MAKFGDIIKKKLDNRKSFPIVFKEKKKDNVEMCQGCNLSYIPDDVMIVEGIGPVCLNCLHDIAKRALR